MAAKSSKSPVRGTEKLSSAGYQIPHRAAGVSFEERGLSLLSERRMDAKRVPPVGSSFVVVTAD